MIADKLLDIFERLLGHYGPQHWWPAETPFEMIVGAILTQSVSWANVTKAIANLKRVDALEPAVLAAMPVGELAQLIRSSRFYNMKAGKIVAFLEHLIDYDYDLDAFFSKDVVALRGELLSIKGVGMETADSIILYGAHKPIFVIDAYTRQLMARLGLVPSQIGYEQLRSFFEINLPSDLSLFQEYHALIVHHCNRTCQKRPSCMGCPLISLCQFAGAN